MPTPIRGRDTITATDALQRIRAASPRDVRPADTADYVRELVALCVAFGLRHTVLLSQWHHETAGGGPEGRWRELNAAGLGITSSSDPTPYKILDGTEAAALHVWSMLVALREWNSAGRIILPPAAIGWVRRWSAKYNDPACPLVTNVEDLNRIYAGDRATWAVDAKYATKLLATMGRLFPATGESENAVSVIPVPAPPVEIAITPPGANRPALPMPSPDWITVHEVGNQSPGADETMHKWFVHNGGGPAQVSFHFVVGPTKVIQLLPLDEAAWHASDGFNGTGNRNSIAIETIQIGNFDRTLWHLAWLINEIATNPGRFFRNNVGAWDLDINHIKQHHDWAPDGKNCPEFIRNRGLWPELMRRVDLWHALGLEIEFPDEEPQPEPEPDKHTIPAGESIESLRRYYGKAMNPVTGKEEGFDITKAPSQRWLAEGKKTGRWPKIKEIVLRGNGDLRYSWEGGFHWTRKA